MKEAQRRPLCITAKATLGDMHAGILVHEGIKTPAELAEVSPRLLGRLLNLEIDNAERIIAAASEKAKGLQHGTIKDTSEYRAEDAAAAPDRALQSKGEDMRQKRLSMFQKLKGVGEATAHALADAGYVTIGDIIADSADEVAQKSGLSLGIARTVQIAADRYLQEQSNNEVK